MNTYVCGWNGKTKTLAELQQWSQWIRLDPEYQRRALAVMDDSITAGRPVGIGEIFRTFAQQDQVFRARHFIVPTGGCCSHDGKRWALRSGMAHAAPPDTSYHEATTPDGDAIAIDWLGDLKWLAANQAKYGLAPMLKELWHKSPASIPLGRKSYRPSLHHPLPVIALPGKPTPAPLKVWAPKAPLIVGERNSVVQAKAFQHLCNYWGWRDSMNRTLIVDGEYAKKSAEACISMQRALGLFVDGDYGKQSQNGLQAFLDAMVAL